VTTDYAASYNIDERYCTGLCGLHGQCVQTDRHRETHRQAHERLMMLLIRQTLHCTALMMMMMPAARTDTVVSCYCNVINASLLLQATIHLI